MRKKLVWCLMVLVLSMPIGGCQTKPQPKEGASAPLQTDGSILPPKGCQELRERGGAC